jgi:hypothetical protein
MLTRFMWAKSDCICSNRASARVRSSMSVSRMYQRAMRPGVIANWDAAVVKPPIFAVEAPQALVDVEGNPGGHRSRKNFNNMGKVFRMLRPAGEAALVSPDSVSPRVFKNPLSLFIGGVTAVTKARRSPLADLRRHFSRFLTR